MKCPGDFKADLLHVNTSKGLLSCQQALQTRPRHACCVLSRDESQFRLMNGAASTACFSDSRALWGAGGFWFCFLFFFLFLLKSSVSLQTKQIESVCHGERINMEPTGLWLQSCILDNSGYTYNCVVRDARNFMVRCPGLFSSSSSTSLNPFWNCLSRVLALVLLEAHSDCWLHLYRRKNLIRSNSSLVYCFHNFSLSLLHAHIDTRTP